MSRSLGFQHGPHRGREVAPRSPLARENLRASGGYVVVASLLPARQGLPSPLDKAVLLHPVERGVERAFTEVEVPAAALFQFPDEFVSVRWPIADNAQDQTVGTAFQKLSFVARCPILPLLCMSLTLAVPEWPVNRARGLPRCATVTRICDLPQAEGRESDVGIRGVCRENPPDRRHAGA